VADPRLHPRNRCIHVGFLSLAVADVVEAMASHRPYRASLGLEAALAEVRGGAGGRYDAAAVAACERVFAQGFVFPEP